MNNQIFGHKIEIIIYDMQIIIDHLWVWSL